MRFGRYAKTITIALTLLWTTSFSVVVLPTIIAGGDDSKLFLNSCTINVTPLTKLEKKLNL